MEPDECILPFLLLSFPSYIQIPKNQPQFVQNQRNPLPQHFLVTARDTAVVFVDDQFAALPYGVSVFVLHLQYGIPIENRTRVYFFKSQSVIQKKTSAFSIAMCKTIKNMSIKRQCMSIADE